MISVRLNPIVVKELRQGLKSKSFLVCFLGLQAFMVLSMSIYFMNAHSPDGLRGANGFFWTMIGMALLFFMPLRSFFGIYNEVRSNTLELLFLTHMRSTQITGGKWMAQAVQVLMLVSSILPYFVLRYLIGTINITQDFQTLGTLLLLSLVMLGVGTGLSAWKSKMLRVFIIGGTVFMMFSVPNMLLMLAYGGLPFGFFSFGMNTLTFLLLGITLILIFLEHGASVIAPPAENHARPKRILSLLLFSILYGTGVVQSSQPWLIASIAALFPYYFAALAQPVTGIPSLYKPQRYPAFLHFFLLPGWPSAFLPILLLLVLPVVTLLTLFPRNELYLHLFPILFGILFLPVALLELMKVRPARWMMLYLLINVCFILLGVTLLITAEIQRSVHGSNAMSPVLNLLPFTALFQMVDLSRLSLTLNWIPAALAGLLLILHLPRPLKHMREMTKFARSPADAHAE